jgi:3-hydroxyacyl-[acyl-carrier-protein] dehydratase
VPPAADAFADVVLAAGSARAVVRRAHAERLCEGHFHGDPLVPGAYLVDLMAQLGSRLLGGGRRALAEVVQCLFLARVRPDREIVVTARASGPDEVAAEVHADGARAARAVLRFAAAG